MRHGVLLALAAGALAGCAAPAAGPPAVGDLVVLAAPQPGPERFVGSGACRQCHPQAYARWRQSAHGADHAGLPEPDRADLACLRCHVTERGEPAEAGAGEQRPPSVGCEACHGPGADHAGSGHPELVPTATGGECPPCEANRICRLCHTPAHSPAFELAGALRRIGCGGAAAPRP